MPAMPSVGTSSAGDPDVADNMVPLDSGLTEAELLAEGVHSSHAFLELAAGPDVAEEGHGIMLRFIRTWRNTKMVRFQGAEQTGGFASRLWLDTAQDPCPKLWFLLARFMDTGCSSKLRGRSG